MSFDLYRRFVFGRFGWFKRTSSIPSGLIQAKETSFFTKRKVVKDNLTHGNKATISTWKVIKIQFNFALWFVDWIPNQAHCQKNFEGRFRVAPHPNGAMQNHSMLRPGYRSVQFLVTKCTVGIIITYCYSICAEKNWSTLIFMLQENAPSWQCVEWMTKRTYVSLISHGHPDHNLLNMTAETFSCILTPLAMFSCLA